MLLQANSDSLTPSSLWTDTGFGDAPPGHTDCTSPGPSHAQEILPHHHSKTPQTAYTQESLQNSFKMIYSF